jgi:molybdopterin-guanine dinucleotide biosynthesis protein A
MKGPAISAIILAGGQARRMGGTDKAMQMLGSKPLIGWVLERLRPQVEEILINTNQKNPAYQDWGLTLFRDEISGFVGPLAGLHQGLQCAQHELVATVPCDSPFLPLDLIARLYQGLVQEEAQLAVARTGDQLQPVFCLCRKSVLGGLTRYLESGGRKIDTWYQQMKISEVLFDDQVDAFSNINTMEELALLTLRAEEKKL